MLQNRVDPFGNIIKTKARGAWMGNRGVLHNDKQHIVRPYKVKAWITCLLEFKDRKRQVMAPNRYTELFFLDEATAFAAGHRPCAECRRADYNRFKLAWLKGNPEYGFDEKVSIQEIDKILHEERIDHGAKRSYKETIANIPDGTFVLLDEQPFLLAKNKLFQWSPSGYEAGKPLPDMEKLTVLTPKSMVHSFRAGYKPQMAIDV